MDAIAGLDEEGFRARPPQGGWTAAETLAHLLITERINTDRARAALTQDEPVFAAINDEQRREQARSAQRMPVPQIVHGLLAQRRDVVSLLAPLSPQQLARTSSQEGRGPRTVAQLFAHIAGHEEEHAEQVRASRAVQA